MNNKIKTPLNFVRTILIAGLPLVAGGSIAWADTFTVDPISPSLFAVEDVLLEGPVIGMDRSTMGLMIGDRINALSDGADPVHIATHGNHNHLFSVSRASLGLIGSGVEAERLADSLAPGGPMGHPADIFLWDYTMVGMNFLAPAGEGYNFGSTDGDESNAGLVTSMLVAPGDNVNSYDTATLAYGTVPPTAPPYEVYFSLAPGSPTLAALPAAPSDILAVGGVFGPVPVIFIHHTTLGIPATVNIDALSLELDPAGIPLTVEFSVSAPSATGWGYGPDFVNSGCEIMYFDMTTGAQGIAHFPAQLALDPLDEIDAIEAVLPVVVIPGDVNGDGIVDIADMLSVLSAWGSCPGCPEDLDGDGNVGVGDLLIVLANWT